MIQFIFCIVFLLVFCEGLSSSILGMFTKKAPEPQTQIDKDFEELHRLLEEYKNDIK